jgi:hypothetical protein
MSDDAGWSKPVAINFAACRDIFRDLPAEDVPLTHLCNILNRQFFDL